MYIGFCDVCCINYMLIYNVDFTGLLTMMLYTDIMQLVSLVHITYCHVLGDSSLGLDW
jgi:hypothetical protein